jgi:integrase
MGISRTQDGIYKVKARVRIRGKIVQKQCTLTGSTREAAKVVLEKFKAELRALDTAGRSLKLKTFGEALTFYCERHEIGKSKSLFDRMQSDLGAVELRELADRFDNYLQLLKRSKAKRTGKPLSNGTINRYIAWAKASLNFAVLHGLIKENPLRGRRFPKFDEIAKDRILSPDEQARLLAVLEREAPHLLPAVNFARQVPCRTNEIVNMRREHLNLFKNTITVPGKYTKNGEPCVKILPPNMLEYFRTLPRETEFIFYRKNKSGFHSLGCFKKAWLRVLKIADIKDFVFHSLRHCAVTSLRNAGTPDHCIHELAGWKNGDFMMKKYYGFREEKLFELVRFPGQCENKCENQKLKIG